LKQSQHITYREAEGFLDRAHKAWMQGSRWNFFVTILLEQGGIAPSNATQHTRESLRRLARIHTKNGFIYSYGWVLENTKAKGTHVHILLHRPDKNTMHPMQYWWAILRAFQFKRQKNLMQARQFYSWRPYGENLANLTAYMLKGIRLEAAGLLGLRASTQGTIYCRRVGWSR